MDAAKLTSDLISAANAITGFAVLQNIAFAYALLKRDLNLRIEGLYQWAMVLVGALWNGTYIWIIWWCSAAALNISVEGKPSLSPEMVRTYTLLAVGKCTAAGFFGFWPVWLLLIYNYKPFWPRSTIPVGNSRPGQGRKSDA